MVYIVAYTVILLQSESDDEGDVSDECESCGEKAESTVWTAILHDATFAMNNGISTLRESTTKPRWTVAQSHIRPILKDCAVFNTIMSYINRIKLSECPKTSPQILGSSRCYQWIISHINSSGIIFARSISCILSMPRATLPRCGSYISIWTTPFMYMHIDVL